MPSVLKSVLLFALMLAASSLAVAMRPTRHIAEQGAPVKLETMVPQQFGSWHEEPQNQTLIVDPQQKEMVDRLYTQTLTRTYISKEGYRIMLSIAYGNDQSDAKQVHKPEVCYPAQGFIVKNKQYGLLTSNFGKFPVTRIETSLGQRNEPVTYWITVADKVVGPGLDKKLTELRYGLRGEVPDGLLFRISSIDGDSARAYDFQTAFAEQLLAALSPGDRQKFIGNPLREQ